MGLRDQKKNRLRGDIERCTLELVIERGVDAVTIEDICAAAEISKKTFFNYFPSKAAAIVGYRGTFPEVDELVEALHAGEDVDACYLDTLVHLFNSRVVPSDDAEVARLRGEALRAMPQLFFQQQKAMFGVHHIVAQAVTAYLGECPARRMVPDLSLDQEAFIASSSVSSIARIRSMLVVEGHADLTAAQTRELLARCLLAAPESAPSSGAAPSPSSNVG
ncbi:MAG: TetR family transcriptional regulator [Coriobacteriia bacterium]|nr:TetR family transcriptional regulator [Coriobacteriia bacterium]MBS5477300.1 TetR family transcriptional regulator [Coriobacteriia bacterium]